MNCLFTQMHEFIILFKSYSLADSQKYLILNITSILREA